MGIHCLTLKIFIVKYYAEVEAGADLHIFFLALERNGGN